MFYDTFTQESGDNLEVAKKFASEQKFQVTSFGGTPLILVVQLGYIKTVRFFLEGEDCPETFKQHAIQNINKVMYFGQITALHYAVENGSAEMLLLLLKHGADTTQQDIHSQTPLSKAVYFENLEIIEILLKQPNPGYQKNSWKETPLIEALRKKSIKISELLLNSQNEVLQKQLAESINEKSSNMGKTALHCAVDNPEVTVIHILMLLNLGASCIIEDLHGYSPLIKAIENNRVDIVELFLNQCSVKNAINDVFQPSGFETTILQCAIAHKMPCCIISQILEAGANINYKNRSGLTALHRAIGYDQSIEQVVFLLDNRAACNVIDDDGRTVLFQAVFFQREDIFAYLLSEKNPQQMQILQILNHRQDNKSLLEYTFSDIDPPMKFRIAIRLLVAGIEVNNKIAEKIAFYKTQLVDEMERLFLMPEYFNNLINIKKALLFLEKANILDGGEKTHPIITQGFYTKKRFGRMPNKHRSSTRLNKLWQLAKTLQLRSEELQRLSKGADDCEVDEAYHNEMNMIDSKNTGVVSIPLVKIKK